MTKYTTRYRDIKKRTPRSVRNYARTVALNGLALKTKLTNSTAIFQKPRIQFLYIHHVFDDELAQFDQLLKELSKHHFFISYSEAVNKILTGTIDQPYISISSDDGFKNNIKAAKILDKYGIKACFFINPDTIEMNNFDENQLFCQNKLNFPPTEFMDWNDINALMKNGHEIGSHTMGHINISETAITKVEDNINKSFELLEEKCGNVSHFAYPYGRFFHFNKEAHDLVFKAGFTSCASAERGCHIPSNRKLKQHELLIRRDHVICDWNINHILYFIYNNSKNATPTTNLIPYS